MNMVSKKGKWHKQCGPANNVIFMEWNKNKNNIKRLKDSILYPSHGNGFGICVFWMLVGAVKQYNTLT